MNAETSSATPTTPRRIGRGKAAAIHLSISAVAALLVGSLLYFLWFPSPWFVAAGASALMLVLMGVDVCIGPLLTLVVFNPHKTRRAIHFDLAVIAILQTAAFVYGAWVIYQARPVFVVGEVDRLVLVADKEIGAEDRAQATLQEARTISWSGPRLIGTSPPKGPDSFDIIAQAMKGGKDLNSLPQYYVPYADVAPGLLQRAHKLEELKGLTARQERKLRQLSARAAKEGHRLLFLPVERQDHFYTAIIRADNAMPVAVIALDPWESGSVSHN